MELAESSPWRRRTGLDVPRLSASPESPSSWCRRCSLRQPRHGQPWEHLQAPDQADLTLPTPPRRFPRRLPMPESPRRPSSSQECPALACHDPTPASSASPCAERQAAAIVPRNEQELAQAPWRRCIILLRPVTFEQRHPPDLLELASPLRLKSHAAAPASFRRGSARICLPPRRPRRQARPQPSTPASPASRTRRPAPHPR